MQFYSTNNRNLRVGLKQAVMQGLAADKGLYLPVTIPSLSNSFFTGLSKKSFKELSLEVVTNLLGADLPVAVIKGLIDHTIQFDAPLVSIEAGVYSLELYHGPTLAFKDFGARFLSGLVSHFAGQEDKETTILVATSGDTGSAVANGFLNVPRTKVIVLYPSGKVSEIQEKQFTTLGANITALEVDGTFDDCQRLVKQAFLDKDIASRRMLTSANSINIARLIPQLLYYFRAYAQLQAPTPNVVFSVPSGNFGNLTAGLLAKKMGLPISKLIASTNSNDVVPEYLVSGLFSPRPSKQTISNAMDVGDPSNFVRLLDLYDHNRERLAGDITGFSITDDETRQAMHYVYESKNYCMDPHGAVGYSALKKYMKNHPGVQGIFLETAHPAKFKDVVENAIQTTIDLPERLEEFLAKKKVSIAISAQFEDLRSYLMSL